MLNIELRYLRCYGLCSSQSSLISSPLALHSPLRTMSSCSRGAECCANVNSDSSSIDSTNTISSSPSTPSINSSDIVYRASHAASLAMTPLPGTSAASSALSTLSSLLESRQVGYSMPSALYLTSLAYGYDLKYIWRRGWLFAGYTCQLQKSGDYFTYEIGGDSIIIIKGDDDTDKRESDSVAHDDDDGSSTTTKANTNSKPSSSSSPSSTSKIRAFHNTCRHRGSRLVPPTSSTQHTKRLVCPYHQWSYGRDGALLHARDMPAAFNKDENGLNQVHAEEVDGLIFICITPIEEKTMWPFAPARELIHPQLHAHGLRTQSKIAHSATYTIHANWKLVYENNRECYHCAIGHPEYVKANYDLNLTYKKVEGVEGKFERDLDPHYPGKARVLAHMNARTAEWESSGFSCSPDSSFPGDGWFRASRMPLKLGFVTESIDGAPVSTMMGTLPQRDMGSLRIHTLPNYWIHLSSDHAVSSRLTPTGPLTTDVRVDWLVAHDAIEGVDYHLSTMLPFWSKTSDQDWHLCEVNQAGVASSAYKPGMLSERKESGLDRYIQWYINTMKEGIDNERKEVKDREKKEIKLNMITND